MKNFRLIALLLCMSFILFLSSCNKDEEGVLEEELVQVEQDILSKVLNSDQVLNFNSKIHGNLVTSAITIEEIIDNGMKDAAIITIPIQGNVKNQAKGLYIYYDYLTQEFNFEVIAVTYGETFVNSVINQKIASTHNLSNTQLQKLSNQFNATYEFISLQGNIDGRLTYKNNILVEDYENASKISWWCMFKCMAGKTSWGERLKCGLAVINCWSGNWVGCVWNIYGCAKNGPRYYRECKRVC